SPARYEVDQRDVPDAAYRTALFNATVGSLYKAPGSGEPTGPSSIDPDDRPQPRPPAPPRGGPPFSFVPPTTTRLDVSALPGRGADGGAGLALAVGLVALWGATRWKRRRR
ncbi:MAG: hypothetical protein K0V04_26165, partial [Deltaproteobacteria bacterium]|nr:hypothetical protein [Deltaproteobacteria bacterium]